MIITTYLAGPISGKSNCKEIFDEAEFRLQNEGQVILNPAKLLEGMEDRDCLPVCLQLIELADYVVLLPGWKESLGATTEALYALRQGKIVHSWDKKYRKFYRLRWNPSTGYLEEHEIP